SPFSEGESCSVHQALWRSHPKWGQGLRRSAGFFAVSRGRNRKGEVYCPESLPRRCRGEGRIEPQGLNANGSGKDLLRRSLPIHSRQNLSGDGRPTTNRERTVPRKIRFVEAWNV